MPRASALEQKPDQREPQLAGVRHGPIVDEDFGERHWSDQLEQIAQLQGIGWKESRPVSERRAASHFAVLRGPAREVECPRVVRSVELREDERDRERQVAGSEQRRVHIGIECGQFLGGGLLRSVDVRPEPFERPRTSVRKER